MPSSPTPAPVRKSASRRPVRVAIIGTGGMAKTHAKAYATIPGCTVVGAADVDEARVTDFAARHAIPHAVVGAERLLAEVECDAVSIVAPDAFHASLSIQALAAGKHVLCEKPLALDHPEARRMVAAARRAGTVNLVNFSYRNWPCLHAVAARVAAGDIGEVVHVEASYLQSWLLGKMWGDWRTSPGWLWRLSKRHGSKGVLGDIGVHIVDFATYPAGPIKEVFCRLKAFPKAPGNRVGAYRLDANDSAVLNVEFKNGALGTIHTTRWSGGHANRLFLKISGTRGALMIDSERSTTSYWTALGEDLDRGTWNEEAAAPVPSVYTTFIARIRGVKKGEAPHAPDFARGAEVQRVLDACFESDSARAPVRV